MRIIFTGTIIHLFIGEFAIYQVFAQMKHNLNFDAFYLIKYLN
jgi:hypothetical protein